MKQAETQEIERDSSLLPLRVLIRAREDGKASIATEIKIRNIIQI